MNTSKLLFSFIFLFFSCGLKQKLNYSSDFTVPDYKFNDTEIRIPLDYNNEKNWAFRSDKHDFNKILPKNYCTKNEKS